MEFCQIQMYVNSLSTVRFCQKHLWLSIHKEKKPEKKATCSALINKQMRKEKQNEASRYSAIFFP